jgi:minimal PKS ketosynthase (KS/KS alpha)
MCEQSRILITGLGFKLPDRKGVCNTKERFWHIVKEGECHLSALSSYEEFSVKVAGQVKELDISPLGLPPKYAVKYSRAALMGTLAVKNAMLDAGLNSKDFANDRSLLISASSVYALENVNKQYKRYLEGGASAVGFDYFLQGTPPSVPGSISNILGLDCPVFTIAGSCIAGPHIIQLAYDKICSGQIDRAILVGSEAVIDPLYLASISYKMKNGETIASMSSDPYSIRPHDKNSTGNACGEGAVAVILERAKCDKECACDKGSFKIYYSNSRQNGKNLFHAGEPDYIERAVKTVLDKANISMSDVGFINSFSEGSKFVEYFFCDAIKYIRKGCSYDGEIILTNQEAAFGHAGGTTGIIKFISNIMMMGEGIVTPTINCIEAYEGLDATPVIGKYIKKESRYSMIINTGAGGDCTATILEKCS